MNLALKSADSRDGANRRDKGGLQSYNAYRDAIYEKKLAKVNNMRIKNATKDYKKFLIKKRFEED